MTSSAPRYPMTEIKELLEWAVSKGALRIVVGDVEVLFPAEGPKQEWTVEEKPAAEEISPPPVYRSPLDDPDFYSSEMDQWSQFQPPSNS